jgi:hypothetical protein
VATNAADYAKACVLVAHKKLKRIIRISDQFLVSNLETNLFLIVSNFETSLFLNVSGCFYLFLANLGILSTKNIFL